jgi:hypothetical protein
VRYWLALLSTLLTTACGDSTAHVHASTQYVAAPAGCWPSSMLPFARQSTLLLPASASQQPFVNPQVVQLQQGSDSKTQQRQSRSSSGPTSAGDDTGHLSSSAPRKVRTYSAGSRWSYACNASHQGTARRAEGHRCQVQYTVCHLKRNCLKRKVTLSGFRPGVDDGQQALHYHSRAPTIWPRCCPALM